MANSRIREAAADAGVRLWQIAARIGVTDATFSRRLRFEMPEAETTRILHIIEDIRKESSHES